MMNLFDEIEAMESIPEKIRRVYETAKAKINKAELTDCRRARLLADIKNDQVISSAAAYMLETISGVNGKIYDVNSKAAMIRGEVSTYWNKEKSARAEGEEYRAYTDDKNYICIYQKNNSRDTAYIKIVLTETEGKKARIDATQTAENMKKIIDARLSRIESAATFAENVKIIEEKKAAIQSLMDEISKLSTANYDTLTAFGFTLNSYSMFKTATIR